MFFDTTSCLLVITVTTVSSLGEFCVRQWHCGKGTFCHQNVCRKDSCSKQADCQPDEMCLYGSIGRTYREACFPFAPFSESKSTTQGPKIQGDLCPGGGKEIILSDGTMERCDLHTACRTKSICNPRNGICCTKLRTCLAPARPLLNLLVNKPIICKMYNEHMITCPEGTFCEERTGFCCGMDPTTPEPPMRPRVGSICNTIEGCSGNAACICETTEKCTCQCPAELGYTLDTDGMHCRRVRRRLREKCKSNAECQAAYSECTSGGCRCKTGFQRDKSGGCKPIAYRCANKHEPLKKGNEIRTCRLQFGLSKREADAVGNESPNLNNTETVENTTYAEVLVAAAFKEGFTDDCPSEYYCVPMFDHPKTRTLQGFCCPLPSDIRPVCPVGVAHESSSAPDYGCEKCPVDYFCHRDKVFTDKEICCPKPCIAIEDLFINGQCYPIVQLGETCQVSEQCVTADEGRASAAVCEHGICKCPRDYVVKDGSCKKASCTIGWKGEPSVDSKNRLIHCSKTSDCATGYMCDLLSNVCCKGINRCPKGATETAASCTDGTCVRNGDFCNRPPKGKEKICCRQEK